MSWSGGGTVVGSAQAISGTSLVQGINFAVAGSANLNSANCPLSSAFSQYVSVCGGGEGVMCVCLIHACV